MDLKKIPKNSKSKAPSFQFYPSDWRGDLHLQACSIAAKGLWIELMCLMHESKEYGFLTINGMKPDDKLITKLVSLPYKTFIKLKLELVDMGVLRVDERGFYYSKRMVEDNYIRDVRRKAGVLGGSPLLKQKVKQESENNNKQNPTPSSSSASSSSISNKDKKTLSVKPDLEAPVLYLNEKAKRNYDPKNKANQDLVKARYNEGRTLKDFQLVIDKKVTDWLNDEKMMMYLRPSTLFNRTKFENYLNEPDSPGNLAWAKRRKGERHDR